MLEFGSLFTEDIVLAIFRIPLHPLLPDNSLLWCFNLQSLYTVRSGCWLARKDDNVVHLSPGCLNEFLEFWNHLWQIKVVPNIQHFIWRIANGSFASGAALYKK